MSESKDKVFGALMRVTVDVLSARELINMDYFSKSDPYVILDIGPFQKKTKVIMDNLDPDWRDESHTFYLTTSAFEIATLILHVFDKDVGKKDDLLGVQSINFRDFVLRTNPLIEVKELLLKESFLDSAKYGRGKLNLKFTIMLLGGDEIKDIPASEVIEKSHLVSSTMSRLGLKEEEIHSAEHGDVIQILVIEAKNLTPQLPNSSGIIEPYVNCIVGNSPEKMKTRVIESAESVAREESNSGSISSPRWRSYFEFRVSKAHIDLPITFEVKTKASAFSRASLGFFRDSLSALAPTPFKTYDLWLDLDPRGLNVLTAAPPSTSSLPALSKENGPKLHVQITLHSFDGDPQVHHRSSLTAPLKDMLRYRGKSPNTASSSGPSFEDVALSTSTNNSEVGERKESFTPSRTWHTMSLLESYRAFHSSGAAIGKLSVRILRGSDISYDGKSVCNSYVKLSVAQEHRRTKTSWSTLNPLWDDSPPAVFDVFDLTSCLDITVLHEAGYCKLDTPVHTPQCIGAARICLVDLGRKEISSILHEPVWLRLKNSYLDRSIQGKILVQFDFVFDEWRAATTLRAPSPKELCLCDRVIEPHKTTCAELPFKLSRLKSNVERLSTLISDIGWGIDRIVAILDWEDTQQTIIAFIVFNAFVLLFQPFFVPAAIFLLIMRQRYRYGVSKASLAVNKTKLRELEAIFESRRNQNRSESDSDDLDEDSSLMQQDASGQPQSTESPLDKLKQWTKPTSAFFAFKEKKARYGMYAQRAQNTLGMIASVGERIRNAFNWTHPYQTFVLCLYLFLVVVLFILIRPSYVIAGVGFILFTEKLRGVNNSTLRNLLSKFSDNQGLKDRVLELVVDPDYSIFAQESSN